ncbi:MAG: phosphoribosylanthranilate isomerase [Chloroflexi bacterium]|nr:phosphoribosylanthranilate isomerase [Chloroflexota bacterium]
MTKVKICGIRNLDDALVAAEAGADFIGLVFVPGRRRRLELQAAKVIVSGLKDAGAAPRVVGLFADQDLAEVNRTIEICGLDLAQLCGQESLDYCTQIRAKVIKVVHIPNSASPEQGSKELIQKINAYREAGHLVTLDRLVEGLQGGTGESFDWSIAAQLSRQGSSFLLAGGLAPDNVGQAVATVRPWGVDVSSGVETNGDKDHEKIREFIRSAKEQSAISPQPYR